MAKSRNPEWWLEFYEQHQAIIDVKEYDVSLATSPIRCRLDDGPYIRGEPDASIIGLLFCQELMQICTSNQKRILNYVLEGYRIYEIAEELDRDQRNVSQVLRRIRSRFIDKGITPEMLR